MADDTLKALNLIDGRWQSAFDGQWGARPAQGVQMIGGSADEFRKFNATQDQKWAAVIRKAGIKAD